jgi:hypothetical protein
LSPWPSGSGNRLWDKPRSADNPSTGGVLPGPHCADARRDLRVSASRLVAVPCRTAKAPKLRRGWGRTDEDDDSTSPPVRATASACSYSLRGSRAAQLLSASSTVRAHAESTKTERVCFFSFFLQINLYYVFMTAGPQVCRGPPGGIHCGSAPAAKAEKNKFLSAPSSGS